MKIFNTILTFICLTIPAISQDLNFKVSITSDKSTEPFVMKVSASGTKMIMEPQQMAPQGNMKFLIDNAASKQYMLMDMNGQKMAMAFDMKDFEKASESKTPPKVTITKEARTIDNYKCTKVIVESDEEISDIWITEDVGMQYSEFFKMMSSAKNANPATSIPELKNVKGFPIEIVSKHKTKNTTTTVKIREISKTPVNPEIFSMKGYQVMATPPSK